jgi:hypothetical protein
MFIRTHAFERHGMFVPAATQLGNIGIAGIGVATGVVW